MRRCFLAGSALGLLWLAPSVVRGDQSFYYTVNPDGLTATIGSPNPPIHGPVVIPSTINGFLVTAVTGYTYNTGGQDNYTSVYIPGSVNAINYQAFMNCPNLASVVIDDGAPSRVVGNSAFYMCTSLANVRLGSGITTIEFEAFYQCTALTNVAFGANVTSIGAGAFENCSYLNHVKLPSTVTNIGGSAFAYCNQLADLDLGAGLVAVGTYAFEHTFLHNVVLPDSCVSVADYAFCYCYSLTNLSIGAGCTNLSLRALGGYAGNNQLASITVSPANPVYSSTNGVLFDKSRTTLLLCPPAKSGSYTIPNTVTNIMSNAFNQSRLSSVTVPASVNGICGSAFAGCANFYVYFQGDAPAIIDNGWGTSVFGGANVYVYRLPGANGWLATYSGAPTALWYPQFSYSTMYNGDAIITGYSGAGGAEAIPDFLYGHRVVSLGNNVFAGCAALTSITFGTNLTSIGQNAFGGCTGLTSVTVPDKVTSLGSSVFQMCSNLTTVTVGRGVTVIPDNTFSECGQLTNVTLLGSVTGLGNAAFYDCSSLANFIIPSTVSSIGDNAFAGCTALTGAVVPAGVVWIGNGIFSGCSALASATLGPVVSYIGNNAFQNCTNLPGIVIPGGVTYLGAWAFAGDGALTNVVFSRALGTVGSHAFDGCAALVSVSLSNSVTTVGDSAFYGCSSLVSASLGTGLQTIGSNAFQNCTQLQWIVTPDTTWTLGGRAFAGCVSLTNAVFGWNLQSIGSHAFDGCVGLTGVSLPWALGEIDDGAFAGCSSLTSVTFGFLLSTIGSGAFQNCVNLQSIVLPDRVNALGSWAFAGCASLTNVIFGSGLQTIGDDAFLGCHGLTTLAMPASLLAIGADAFASCDGLTEIYFQGDAPTLGADAFLGDSARIDYWGRASRWTDPFGGLSTYCHWPFLWVINDDATITITGYTGPGGQELVPDTLDGMPVTAIADSVFELNSTVTGITIGNNVKTIGDYAFIRCWYLNNVTLGAGVASIGEGAFFDTDLCTVTIPDTVTNISNSAFAYNFSLTNVTFGSGLQNIGDGAFWLDTALRAVVLPDSLTRIGGGAFSDCYGLTNVVVPGRVTDFGGSAFAGCSSLQRVTLEGGLLQIGDDAFAGCSALSSITIPASVTAIGDQAFAECTGLTELFFAGNAPVLASDTDVFTDVPGLAFRLPGASGWTDNYGGLSTTLWYPQFQWTIVSGSTVTITGYTGGGMETIPDTIAGLPVTRIGCGAFSNCTALTGIVLSGNITAIDAMAFYGCTGLASLVIPDSMAAIGNRAFQGCTGITNLLFGAGVSALGDQAFEGCVGLTAVTIPANITTLGYELFADCTGLAAVYCLGNGAPGLGLLDGDSGCTLYGQPGATGWDDYSPQLWYGHFLCAVNAGAVTLTQYIGPGGSEFVPDNVNGLPITALADNLFANNTALTGITLVENLATIGSRAFAGCSGLTEMFIPVGVTAIGDSAFAFCSNLTAFAVDASNGAFSSPDGVLLSADQTTLIQYPLACNATDYAVSNAVQTIGNHAFAGCTNLVTVTIPVSVTAIGDGAFADCPNLAGLYFLGNPPTLSGDDPFAGDADTGARVYCEPGLSWSYGSTYASLQTYAWFPGYLCAVNGDGTVNIAGYIGDGGEVAIPDNINGAAIVSVSNGAFSNAVTLTSLAIPASVTGIGDDACYGCTALTNVVIGSGLSSIGYQAFYNCPSLAAFAVDPANTTYSSMPDGVLCDAAQMTLLLYPAGRSDSGYTISNGVTSIGSWAFANATKLTSVTIPASVTWIADDAFAACTGLTALYFQGDAPGLGADVFAGVAATVYYPPGANWWDVTYGGLPAYAWSSGFFCSVNWDGTLVLIGYNGPGGDVTIPDSLNGRTVTSIAAGAFSNVVALTSVAIPDSVASLGDNAFYGCHNLASVAIGAGLNAIGYHAFFDCPKLAGFAVNPANTTYSSMPDGVLFDAAQTSLLLYPAGRADSGYAVSNGVTSIGAWAFAGALDLTFVSIPAGVYWIADDAFAGCGGLTALYFLGDEPGLDADVFAGVTATVYYLPGVNWWDVPYGGLAAYAWASGYFCAFNWDGSLTIVGYDGPGGDVTIPDSINGRGVTGIADGAFSNCTALTSVAFPASVNAIGNRAFIGCPNLGAFSVDPANPAYSSTPDGLLLDYAQTTLVRYPPARSDSAYTLPDGFVAIAPFAFSGNTSLTSVALPASLATIGAGPFYGCQNLAAISVDPANTACCAIDGVLFWTTGWDPNDRLVQYPPGKAGSVYRFPDGVVSVGSYALAGCTNLEFVTAPDNLVGLADHAFYGCSNLTTFVFGQLSWWPYSFAVEDGAFAQCPRLAAIYFDNRAPDFGQDVFAGEPPPLFYSVPGTPGWDAWPRHYWCNPAYYCDLLDDGTIRITGYFGAGGAESIQDTFYGIPVTAIASGVFSNCVALTGLYVPASVTNIGDAAFYGCTNLTSFALPYHAMTVGRDAFFGCAGLPYLYFGPDMASLGAGALDGCNGLTFFSVDGNNQTYSSGWNGNWDGSLYDKSANTLIRYPAGKNNWWEQSFGIPYGVATVASRAFADATNLFHVWISSSVSVIAPDAFDGCVNLLDFGVDGGSATFSCRDGVLFDASGTTLVRYPPGKTDSAYSVPDSVLAIAADAFAGCTNLLGITIPVGVASLADGAFAGCTGLTDLYFQDNAPTLGADVFAGVTGTIHHLSGTTGWGSTPFAGLPTVTWYPQFSWTVNADGTLTITGYSGAGGVETIPDAIDGNPVTAIGNGAFAGCGTLSAVLVPAGVINVGDQAFFSCGNLAYVTFDGAAPAFGADVFDYDPVTVGYPSAFALNGWDALPGGFPATALWSAPYVYEVDTSRDTSTILRYLGAGGTEIVPGAFDDAPLVCLARDTFNGCAGLTHAVLPAGLVTIDVGAFHNCTGLIDVAIPEGVTAIGDWGFCNCPNLASVTLPDSLAFIGNWAFCGCNTLPSIAVPANVSAIGYEAFNQCTNLAAILVDAANTSYTNVDGVLFDSQQNLLQYPPARSAATYALPAGTLSIADAAFANCDNLTSVVVPEGVGAIGTYAFQGCANLVDVALPGSLTFLGDNVFESCGRLGAIVIPDQLASVPQWTFHGCTSLASVTIPSSVAYVGFGAFMGCTNLSGITLPDSVTQIGLLAFAECSGLGAIAIPNSVSGIDGWTFRSCTSLTNVTLPSALTGIPGGMFLDCTSLAAIEIPDGVTRIGGSAFQGCANLQHVALPNGLSVIEDTAFYYCTSLSAIELPNTVTSIGGWAFECTALTNLTIPDSVTSVGMWAFSGCPLVHVKLSTNCTHIAWGMFSGCTTLTSIEIPATVTAIDSYAFQTCSSLATVTIPAGITAIGDNAFYGCSGLTALYFEGDAPTLGNGTFALNWWGGMDPATVYHRSDAAGWDAATFGGLQTAVWSLTPPRIVADASFGVQAGHFGFRIAGDANQAVVVEACTNLTSPVWVPVGSKTLIGGVAAFADDDWTNHAVRFYRVVKP